MWLMMRMMDMIRNRLWVQGPYSSPLEKVQHLPGAHISLHPLPFEENVEAVC